MDYSRIGIGIVILVFLAVNLLITLKKDPENQKLITAYVCCLIGAAFLFIKVLLKS